MVLIKNLLEFFRDIILLRFEKAPEPVIVPEPIPTPTPVPEPVKIPTRREQLYEMAKYCTIPARDISPQDVAPDELACVESFDNIYKLTFGTFINGTTRIPTVSTIQAYKIFIKSKEWVEVTNPLPGDVIVCVTGTGRLSNGHIGIVGKTHIMSNNSFTGRWEATHTLKTWRSYYEVNGGFKSRYFRVI